MSSFFYFASGNLNFSSMDIIISQGESAKSLNNNLRIRLKEGILINIFSPKTLITSNGLDTSDGNGIRNYNETWKREIQLNLNVILTKSNFSIDLIWSMHGINLKQNNALTLKSSNIN